MKKLFIWIVIIVFFIINSIGVIRMFELKAIYNISADGWLEFFGTIIGIGLTVVGLLGALYKYHEEQEEKDKPVLVIKPALEKDYNYWCDNFQNDFTLHKKVCFELINKSNNYIKFPQIKNSEGKILNIYKEESEDELEVIETANLESGNRYVIAIDINYYEGMHPYRNEKFEIIYRNYKDKNYKSKFVIEIARQNEKYLKVYMKD